MPTLPDGRNIQYEPGRHTIVDGADINALASRVSGPLSAYRTSLLAQRCGGNGEQGTLGTSSPYLNSHTFHRMPFGADAIALVYAGFGQTGTTPSEASMSPSCFSASSVTLTGGTNYAAGDINTYTVTNTTGITAAKAMVTAISAGGVPTQYQIVDGGAYNTILGTGASQTATTGTGSQATANFTWQAYAAMGKVGIEPVFGNQVFTGTSCVKAAYKGVKPDGNRNNTLLIPMGEFYTTDLIEVDVPVGGAIGLRADWSYNTLNLGRLPMVTAYGYPTQFEEANNIGTFFDESLSGTISAGASKVIYQPVGIIGIPKVPVIAVMAFGSSRETGTSSGANNISGYDIMDADGCIGWFEKAVGSITGNKWSFSNFSRGNDQYSLIIPASNPALTGRAGRMKAVSIIQPTAVYLQDGVNDSTAGVSNTTLIAQETQIIQELKGMGVKYVFTSTTDPVTSSSDTFKTIANQTSSTGSANRIARNAALRAGTWAPYDFFIDFSSAVESSIGSDKWVVNSTANYATGDGIHASPSIITLKAALAKTIMAANIVI